MKKEINYSNVRVKGTELKSKKGIKKLTASECLDIMNKIAEKIKLRSRK